MTHSESLRQRSEHPRSALEHGVQSRPTDLGELADLGLGHAGLKGLSSEGGDGAGLGDSGRAGTGAFGAMGSQVTAEVVHGGKRKALDKGSKVLSMLTTGQDIAIRHPLYGDITAHIRSLGPRFVWFATPGGQEDQVTRESFTAWAKDAE